MNQPSPPRAQLAVANPAIAAAQDMPAWYSNHQQVDDCQGIQHGYQSTLFDYQYQDLIDPDMIADFSGGQQNSSANTNNTDNDHNSAGY